MSHDYTLVKYIVPKVKGISALAEQTGMTRQGLQKALSSKGNPRLDNINSIMHALGYRLMPKKLQSLITRTYLKIVAFV
jgi:probable addiction module antidote protein